MQALPDSVRVATLAGLAARDVAIEIVAETGSTNADLLARATTLAQPTVRWALQQTAGKGRAGRAWLAPENGALTFSLAWKLALPLQALSGLSLAIGCVVSQQLNTFGLDTRLKWPNDVLRHGAKLGGVLIETAVDRNDRNAVWVVIGVGINLARSGELSQTLSRAVADASDVDYDREEWMGALLGGLSAMLQQFERDGFAAFVARWNALDAYAGQDVKIVDQGRVLYQGQAAGVDAEGRLLLDTPEGQVAVIAGDVSLRMAED
ncbi:biotin--[acetyl-CoA-carboxylase] ligase [Oxalicibacterium faecigallinarum]|uniref:biotin--[acetyl-CoA-carboxylase] ligase n=1 Tax=Oxalicibacterium faecigallinarum TaxID=573741 RepID=UPI001669C8DB|nr:biotin--[acetyl-CoA-carboxylase] ligase [Oxalicibacterium faecigallinarum]